MDFAIKSELDSSYSCIACLRNDGQMFGEHEMRTEIVVAYKEIVKDHVKSFKWIFSFIYLHYPLSF